ncbi:EAL domain-containing protein [Pseudoalteromonas sp. SSDWG2]|uniref:EAL domain-containing protein n=1 Tax=Pseudoalteromonas sp. SSDWG2 TaxID=3139391 RepID=UPI003BA8FBE1
MITSLQLSAFISGLFIMALVVSVVLISERKDGISAMFYSVSGLAFISGFWLIGATILAITLAVRAWLLYRQQGRKVLAIRGGLLLAQLLLLGLALAFTLHSAWLAMVPLALQMMAFMELDSDDDEQVLFDQSRNEFDDHTFPVISWSQAVMEYNQWRDDNPSQVAMIMIQVEGYEQLNRLLGQEFGELILMQSLARINQYAQQPSVLNLQRNKNKNPEVFQVSPLCFGLLVEIEPQSHSHEQLARQIADSIHKPFNSRQGVIELTSRIALTKAIAKQTPLDDLVQQTFKTIEFNPSERVCVYNAELEQMAKAHRQQLKELTTVSFDSDFELYFQPVVATPGNKIMYVELLLRWRHPERGVIDAREFIQDLREVGRGYKLAFYVLERAAEMAMALKLDGLNIPVSINLFGEEILHDEFVDFAERMLREHSLKGGDLIIECPLPVFMSLDDGLLSLLTRLRQVGIHLCLDGLGDTPLFLAKFPRVNLDYVKVDPTLTAEVDYTSGNKALLNGLIDMHRFLKAKVICQGIESQAQLSYVKEFSIDGVQGFLFTHPLRSDGVLGWARQWQHKLQKQEMPY